MIGAMSDIVVVLNAGSSSIKFAVHALDDGPAQYRGQIEALGVAPALKVRDSTGAVVAEHTWQAAGMTHEVATHELVRVIVGLVGRDKVAAVGHRVVHGHTPVDQPYADARRIAVDTGAYASGTLTAARFEGEALTFLSVRRPNVTVSTPSRTVLADQVDWG